MRDRPHVEDDDVLGQLLAGRGPRCGCAVRVRSEALSGRSRRRLSVPPRRRRAVQPELLDQPRDGGRDEAVDRLAGRARGARISRRRHGHRRNLEEDRPAPAARPRQHRRPAPPRSKPGRVATPSRASRSTSFGPLPGEEVGEAVGADEEDAARPSGRAPSARCRTSTRAAADRRRCATTSAPGTSANAASASRSRISGSDATALPGVRPVGATSSRSSPKWSMPARASATWPSCGGSNVPPSSPITPSSQRLVADDDLVAALHARRRAAPLELLRVGGGRPATRKPRSVRSTR